MIAPAQFWPFVAFVALILPSCSDSTSPDVADSPNVADDAPSRGVHGHHTEDSREDAPLADAVLQLDADANHLDETSLDASADVALDAAVDGATADSAEDGTADMAGDGTGDGAQLELGECHTACGHQATCLEWGDNSAFMCEVLCSWFGAYFSAKSLNALAKCIAASECSEIDRGPWHCLAQADRGDNGAARCDSLADHMQSCQFSDADAGLAEFVCRLGATDWAETDHAALQPCIDAARGLPWPNPPPISPECESMEDCVGETLHLFELPWGSGVP